MPERAVRGRLRMFVFGSRVSGDSAACRARTHGHRRPVRVYRVRRDITRPPSEVRELGEIDMVARALATLDLVGHDGAQPGWPAVFLEGHAVLSYGELAGLAGESGRVLRHDGKPLVLCAGDRDLRSASCSADQR
jgi:hypothetical protein